MTPIDPPPGQLDKVAEAIRDCGHASPRHACMTCAWAETAARAVWDAVAEGLGLGEETRMHTHVGPGKCSCGFDAYKVRGIMLDYHGLTQAHFRAVRDGRAPSGRRLVSKWEPQP